MVKLVSLVGLAGAAAFTAHPSAARPLLRSGAAGSSSHHQHSSTPRRWHGASHGARMNFDFLSALDMFYKSAPYEAAFVTCGVKAAASDGLAQQTERNGRPQFSWPRNLAFILYGGFYQGCFQNFVFNTFYPAVFGTGTDVATVAIKVVFDQLVLTPFLCLPCAYLVKAAVFRYPLQEGLQRYVADAKKDLLLKYWAIWTPAQCFTFSIVPEHLRIAFIAFVSFFWLILLSTISNRTPVREPVRIGRRARS